MEKVEQRVRRAAIFIDLPNLIISAKQFGYETNKVFYKLLDLSKQHGKIAEGFAYGDFERLKLDFSVQRALVSQNIALIHCPANSSGENKIEDPMLVEGVHASLRKNSDVFYVFVTGDVMILPVSMTLRSLNKNFRVLSFSESASSLLKRLPEFIDLSRFLKKESGNSQGRKNEISGKTAN